MLRKFGLEFIGDVPWGTHLCQFYETKEDLIDILVPYFAEGLRNNEFCMWVTSPPLGVEEAKQALRKVVPELDQYIRKGQIEILPYSEWYLLGGAFDSDRVLQGWVKKERVALSQGFDGLRLTGNTFWLDRNGWKAFTDYEEQVNNVISKYRMIAVCTYSLDKCNANEVIDVVKNHQFALVKRSGKWELIECSEAKKIQSALLKSEMKFSALYSSMIEGVAFHNVVYDGSGKAVDYVITDVNPSYEKITGLSKKRAIGKKASELYGTGEPPYLDICAKVASSGKPASFETCFPPMQKHFSIFVYSPSKGKFTMVFHDITKHKKAEQALSQAKRDWERTFDSVPTLIAILDNQRKIVRANRAMAHRLGMTPEQCIGLRCFKCVHGTDIPPSFCPYTQTLQNGQEHIAEMYEDHLRGNFFVSTTPLMNEQGQMIGSVHVARDITEIKRAEEEIKRLNKFQKRVFESIKDELMVIDVRDFTVLAANKALLENVKLKEDEVIGKPCYEVTHRKSTQCSPPNHTCPITEMLKTSKPITVEHTHYDGEGNLYYVEVSAYPITDEKENTIQAVHLARDITERKRIEQALRENQMDLNRAQAVAKTGSWRLDVRRNELLWSDETHRMFGIPKGAPMTYETFLGAVHPDDQEYVDQKWKAALRGEPYDIEHRIVVNGEVKWVREKAELEFNQDGVLLGGFGTVQDITELKHAEERLSKLNRTLMAISNSDQALMRIADEATLLQDVCRIIVKDCGYALVWVGYAEEDEAKTVRPVAYAGFDKGYIDSMKITWADSERGRGPTGQAIRTGKPYVCRNMMTDPHFLPWREQAKERGYASSIALPLISNSKVFGSLNIYSREPDPFSEDEVNLLTELANDFAYGIITLRLRASKEQAEKELRESEERFRATFEQVAVGIEMVNVDGQYIQGNLMLQKILGYSEEELHKLRFSDITHPDDLLRELPLLEGLLNGRVSNYTIEKRYLRKDGQSVWVRVTSSLAKTQEPYRISIIEDITERKELQAKVEEYTKHLETLVKEKTKQLKDAERLAAIGQTAGMVGHDIRNPLQSIIGNVYLAQKDSASLPDSEEKEGLLESIGAIGKQTEYINKIVLDLQDFAKPLNPLAEETDLKRLIEELLVRNGVPENIQTNAKVDPDAEKVIADSAYMKRILGNLISNAVQAMPNGGKLGIHAYREAEDIVVTVKDTGTGIPEEAKPKLFQPLFTTKSKGQGFGLAVVKRLTEALNGTITFESQEGKGTKFTMRFPPIKE